MFEDTQQMVQLYQAIDSIKHQYGEKLLMRGSGFEKIESSRSFM
jgi:DNA polymerase-4